MDFQPNTNQTLLLWKLLVMPDYQPMQSKVIPKISKKEREALVDAGLLQLEKRGRATHILLADKAWDQAVDYFDADIPLKSQAAGLVLQQLMIKLKAYLLTNDVPVAEFLSPPLPPALSVEEQIRIAYATASDGVMNVRVLLADLRKYLAAIPRDVVDQTLRQMQLEGKLTVMSRDDPQSITGEDEAAAVDIHGEKQHIVYLGG